MAAGAEALAGIPPLGVGMGFRAPYRGDVFMHRGEVDFLEITADHYFGPSRERAEELALLADHYTLIPHGLHLSLGSAEGIDAGYGRAFAEIVRRVRPPYWSEHIAFTRADGIDVGHLAPLPFTRQAVDVVCRNVDAARRLVGEDIPLVLENITYTMTWPGAEMTEARFLTEILERTGCGLLLDVTNLHTNAVNHGFRAADFLDGIPLDRVVQCHFAGGVWDDGMLVDSHSAPTPDAVWELLDEVVARSSVRGLILERDEHLPPFAEAVGEMRRAREIMRRHGRWPAA